MALPSFSGSVMAARTRIGSCAGDDGSTCVGVRVFSKHWASTSNRSLKSKLGLRK